MVMAIPTELFTTQSMSTLAGATVITTIITNVFQHAFNWNPKWLGLIVAIVVSVVGAVLTTNPDIINYVMGVINGFLVYASSAGVMQMVGKPVSGTGDGTTRSAKPIVRRFNTQWF